MSYKFSDAEEAKLLAILRKASLDAAFRNLCLTNPTAAAASEGLKLAQGRTIRFVEQNDVIAHLPEVAAAREDLTQEELEQVAGGVLSLTIDCRKTRIDCPGSIVVSAV